MLRDTVYEELRVDLSSSSSGDATGVVIHDGMVYTLTVVFIPMSIGSKHDCP